MRRLSVIAFLFAAVFAGAAIGGYLRVWQLQSVYGNQRGSSNEAWSDASRLALSDAKSSADRFVVLMLLASNLGFAFLARSISRTTDLASTAVASPVSEPFAKPDSSHGVSILIPE